MAGAKRLVTRPRPLGGSHGVVIESGVGIPERQRSLVFARLGVQSPTTQCRGGASVTRAFASVPAFAERLFAVGHRFVGTETVCRRDCRAAVGGPAQAHLA